MISKGETISMRCFESFFKHTWRPQQMDSPSKFELATKTAEVHRHAAGETTEMGEVKVTAPSSNIATSMAHSSGSNGMPCKNGGCKIWRNSRIEGSEPRTPESPWHSLKTIFLVSVIVAFLLWIIIYTLLDQYRIL
ncbi:PREDICTED: uncharacterized protein LOC108750870 isoform X2 [Trachymyrmex septentrionalis]|uniref:uncharacterized protein LOC108750870 isoform X2 n=1 Tax=Trachymyrmex septentrionalis TaxID=34720 RepID=UPI00084F4909|nr:PREDICTED: uncharacterized protein LOC108750870 isoform X2 [Trachymyrmex septentrionalis]